VYRQDKYQLDIDSALPL